MPIQRFTIIEAADERHLADAGRLLREYAESLGWDLSSGSRLAEDMLSPPGPYAPPRGSLMLAYAEDEPAGVLGLQPVPEGARIPDVGAETAGELKRLFVRPEWRRHGLGRMLMDRAEAEARSRGYDALVLTTSAEMMPSAQHLYHELGYVTTEPYRDDMPWPQIRWLRKGL